MEPVERPSELPSIAGTLALVLLSIVALLLVDTLLARVQRLEGEADARRLYNQGQQLMKGRQYTEAINRFRSALSVSRGNAQAQLALGQALLAVDRLTDAETVLNEVLQRDPTDGPANLTMARVMVKENRPNEATAFYHQAIYGHWSQDAVANRVAVRFELIDWLLNQHAGREVLAELLPLQDQAPEDVNTRMRIARLYLVAGSPSRAAGLYREVLGGMPQNSEARAGLGEAELAIGNYRLAVFDFQAASRLSPDDQAVRKRLELARGVLALDPLARGLSSLERYRRSLTLLEQVLDRVNSCAAQKASETLRDLMNRCRAAIRQPVSPRFREKTTESYLDLAEQTWQSGQAECGSSLSRSEDLLTLVMTKLAQ